jgi:hypothetical protein
MNVPARRQTGMAAVIKAKATVITEILTVITAKGFVRQRAVMVLIVDIAVSQTTWNSSAGGNPEMNISNLIDSRRRNKRSLRLTKERHRNYSYAAWKSTQN